jgi:hypothetical protein
VKTAVKGVSLARGLARAQDRATEIFSGSPRLTRTAVANRALHERPQRKGRLLRFVLSDCLRGAFRDARIRSESGRPTGLRRAPRAVHPLHRLEDHPDQSGERQVAHQARGYFERDTLYLDGTDVHFEAGLVSHLTVPGVGEVATNAGYLVAAFDSAGNLKSFKTAGPDDGPIAPYACEYLTDG